MHMFEEERNPNFKVCLIFFECRNKFSTYVKCVKSEEKLSTGLGGYTDSSATVIYWSFLITNISWIPDKGMFILI